jgi:hypothetical protein
MMIPVGVGRRYFDENWSRRQELRKYHHGERALLMSEMAVAFVRGLRAASAKTLM